MPMINGVFDDEHFPEQLEEVWAKLLALRGTGLAALAYIAVTPDPNRPDEGQVATGSVSKAAVDLHVAQALIRLAHAMSQLDDRGFVKFVGQTIAEAAARSALQESVAPRGGAAH